MQTDVLNFDARRSKMFILIAFSKWIPIRDVTSTQLQLLVLNETVKLTHV